MIKFFRQNRIQNFEFVIILCLVLATMIGSLVVLLQVGSSPSYVGNAHAVYLPERVSELILVSNDSNSFGFSVVTERLSG